MKTSINDIRNDLINVFNGLRDKTMDIKEATEINNTAGKIINTAKVQLAYFALRNDRPSIEFLEGGATIDHKPDAPKIAAKKGKR